MEKTHRAQQFDRFLSPDCTEKPDWGIVESVAADYPYFLPAKILLARNADDESIEFTSASAALFQSAIFILSVDIREREPPASTYSAFEPHPDESIAAAAHRNDEIITSVFFIFISS